MIVMIEIIDIAKTVNIRIMKAQIVIVKQVMKTKSKI